MVHCRVILRDSGYAYGISEDITLSQPNMLHNGATAYRRFGVILNGRQ